MYTAIADEIETISFAQSKVHQYIGGNVKSPGLVKGNTYIIKYWSAKSTPGSYNPYWLGQFLGAGESADRILEQTPRAKEMSAKQRYFFRKVNGDVVSASNFNGALVVNDDFEQRITFYSLLSEAQTDAPKLEANQKPAAKTKEHSATSSAETKPAKIKPAKHVKVRNTPSKRSVETESDAAANTAFFKSIRELTFSKRPMREAHFRTEEEALAFAQRLEHVEYVKESIWHKAVIRLEDDPDNVFFTLAKQAGAYEVNNYTKLEAS